MKISKIQVKNQIKKAFIFLTNSELHEEGERDERSPEYDE
jgi:hypothetical protein